MAVAQNGTWFHGGANLWWPEVTRLKGDDPPNMKPRGCSVENVRWVGGLKAEVVSQNMLVPYKSKPRWSEVDSSFFEKYVTEKNHEQWWNPAKKMSIDIQSDNYCWRVKSCTTWHVWNPVNDGINYLSTGAGFLPSTVAPRIWNIDFRLIAYHLDEPNHDESKMGWNFCHSIHEKHKVGFWVSGI